MFFASIFSYSQRKRLCAAAYQKTRRNLAERADAAACRSSRGTGSRCGRTACSTPRARVADVLTDPRPLNVGAGAEGQRAADDARPRAHARSSRALARRGPLGPTAGLRAHRRRVGHGGKKAPAPHPRAHPRDEPRALQSRRRAARHDGGHRRRDGHQPGQSLLPLRQQGRDRLRAVRAASRPACCRSSPTAAAGTSTSTTSGCGCTCCSNGCGDTGSSIATSIELTSRDDKLGARFGALFRKGAATVIELCRRHGRRRRDARVGPRDRGAGAKRGARRGLLAVVRPGAPRSGRATRPEATPAARRIRCSRSSDRTSSATRARYLDRLAADYL